MDGGQSGFTEFFEDEYTAVLRVTFVIVGSWHVAQEITQDAFTKAFVNWRRISDYDRPGAWVRRVAIRDAVRSKNRAARQIPLPADQHAAGPELTESAHLLEGLSPKQRAAAALHYPGARPIAPVAAQRRCAEPTVRTHLQRAREALAVTLAATTGASDA